MLTIPLLLGVLGGAGVGAFIGSHTGLVYGVATGYFIAALGFGLYLWNRKKRAQGAACDVTLEPVARRNGHVTAQHEGRELETRR